MIVVSPPCCENEGDISHAKRSIATLYVKKVRKTRMGKRRAEKCAISAIRTSVIPVECPLSGRTKKREDFGSCSIGNSSPSGTNGKRGSFRSSIVCKVLNCCKKCFLCQLYATFLLYFLRQLHTAVNVAWRMLPQILFSRSSILCYNRAISDFNQVETKFQKLPSYLPWK